MTRQQIQDTAREYLSTPFQHQGRLKGTACDCVGLPLMVADELHLIDKNGRPFLKMDNANYGSQPLDRFVHEECQRRFTEKPVDQMQPGDLLTLKLETIPCHVAIVSSLQGGLGIIHAYVGSGKVVEHVLSPKWLKRVEGCFEFPGTTE